MFPLASPEGQPSPPALQGTPILGEQAGKCNRAAPLFPLSLPVSGFPVSEESGPESLLSHLPVLQPLGQLIQGIQHPIRSGGQEDLPGPVLLCLALCLGQGLILRLGVSHNAAALQHPQGEDPRVLALLNVGHCVAHLDDLFH